MDDVKSEEISKWYRGVAQSMRYAAYLVNDQNGTEEKWQNNRYILEIVIPGISLRNAEPPPGMEKLVEGMCLPGFVTGMEAMLRDPSMDEAPCSMLDCVYSAYYLMELITNFARPEKIPFREIMGLAGTSNKLLLKLPTLKESHLDVGWDLLHCMARLMVDHLPDFESEYRVENFKLYVLVSVTVWPLATKMLRDGRPRSGLLGNLDQEMLNQLETMEVEYSVAALSVQKTCTSLWTGMATCCNILSCTNLTGIIDAVLPTTLCTGCRRARYCCVACQRADWVVGGHSSVCGKGAWSLPN